MQNPAVRVPRRDAEATRRRLMELGVLRSDLEVQRDGEDVLFPVTPACGPTLPTTPWEFPLRPRRPTHYTDLLGWPPDEVALAPRAFEQLGDIVLVKVPAELHDRSAHLGEALRAFHDARAVFHDGGVKGEFRTRELSRIAGSGDSLTVVGENGFRFWVDPAKAYFSPRLGGERARMAALVQRGEHVVDLFAGVGAAAIQCAARGARVDAIDLNPDAVALARRNVEENRARNVDVSWGDARTVAASLERADRVVMNLPHGAWEFLDVAAALLAPGASLHYHEIHPEVDRPRRQAALVQRLEALGAPVAAVAVRTVRQYSPQETHSVFDVVLDPSAGSNAEP